MKVSGSSKVSAAARGAALPLAIASMTRFVVGQGGTPVCVPGTNPLQVAVDAAQPGDAIDVGANPNLGERVCVTKPLLFFSATTPPATVTAGPPYPSNTPVGVFHVVPGVSGVVAFQNLQIIGTMVNGLPGPDGGVRGIYSQSPTATLVVDSCTVSGADYGPTALGDNLMNGAAGIEGAVERLVLKDSQVSGGDGDIARWSYDPGPNPSIFCFDTAVAGSGGHAIDVAGEVLLVRSVLAGGNGADANGRVVLLCGCAPPPPSWAVAGSGGSAVVAPTLWSWGSTGIGGSGGVVRCGPAVYGIAPSGASLPPGFGAALQVGPQPTLGGTATLTVLAFQPGVIGIGTTGFAPGIQVPGLGPYFLGPSPIVFPAVIAPGVNSLPVPIDPALVGLAFPVQATAPAGFGINLTNPDVVLILP